MDSNVKELVCAKCYARVEALYSDRWKAAWSLG
jgi:hypothetical protein